MRIITSLILLSISSFSFAQSVERQVIASAGDSYNNTIQVEFTIGETITTFIAADVSLAQGFQQDTATTMQLPLQLLTVPSTQVNSLPLPQALAFNRVIEPICLTCTEAIYSVDQLESVSAEQSNSQESASLLRTEQVQLSLSVYPNPSSGILNVKLETGVTEFPSQASCFIFDHQGKQVYAQPMTGSLQTLNLTPFPAGVYQLQVRLTPTTFKHQTFIITK
ncbi:MAG: T9SS type A sorting domain-containing protein [Saprospiraceae bacterium]